MGKADCLFLPALWIHQVRSTNRSIAVNYWLNHDQVKNAIVNQDTCPLTDELYFVKLNTIQWPKEPSNIENLKNFMLELVNENQTNFKQWVYEFSDVNERKRKNRILRNKLRQFFFRI